MANDKVTRFPQVNVQSVQRMFDDLRTKTVAAAAADRAPDALSMDELADLQVAGDTFITDAMVQLRESVATRTVIPTVVHRPITRFVGGLGGSEREVTLGWETVPGSRVETKTPDAIALTEVNALIARAEAQALAALGPDGELSRSEARSNDVLAVVVPEAHLARQAIATSVAAWLQDTDARNGNEARLSELAGRMFKQRASPDAREAVRWFLRERAATDVGRGVSEGNAAMVEAGSHIFDWLFGSPNDDRLDDRAIAKLVGTTDFAGFVNETRARIRSQLGMSYEDSLKA